MRTTFALNFYCRKSKMNKQGYSPIEVSLIINGKRKLFNLPRKERPEVFEKETRKRTSELSNYLEQTRIRINGSQTELLLAGRAITPTSIKEYIQNGGIKTYTVQDLFNDYLKLLEKRLGADVTELTYQKFKLIRDDFYKHIGNEELEANSITNDIIASYYASLSQRMKQSTTAGKMNRLKAVFKYGFDSGKITSLPFTNIKIRKPRPVIEYLNENEVKKLEDSDLNNDRLNKVKDVFLFQMNTGLSYADMAQLKKEDIQREDNIYYINKNRVKTGVEYTAVILPKGIELLEKYDYKLPILTNQKYNAYLKEIGDILNIKKELHTHLARKTYGTYLLNEGISINVVAKALGHSNTNITQKIYAKTKNTTVIHEVGKLL